MKTKPGFPLYCELQSEHATEALVVRFVTLPLTLSPCGDYQQAVSDVEFTCYQSAKRKASLSDAREFIAHRNTLTASYFLSDSEGNNLAAYLTLECAYVPNPKSL